MRKKLSKEDRERRKLKTLSQKIASAKGLLTDEEIFASSEMNNYLERLANRVLSSVKIPPIKIKCIWNSSNESFIARTNNKRIEINAASELLDGTREERLNCICGLLAHELSHVLFTNFTASRAYSKALLNGKLYPAIPTVDPSLQSNLNALLDFLDGKRGLTDPTYHKDPASDNRKAIAKIAAMFDNIMDDARIEELFSSYYHKNRVLYNGLKCIVKHQNDVNLTLDEILKNVDEERTNELNALMQISLQYARFAEIKGYDRKTHKKLPLIQNFLKIQEYIDDYISSVTAVECYNNVNMILITLFPLIEESILVHDKWRIDNGIADLEKAMNEMLDSIKGRTPNSQEITGEGTDSENIKQNKPQIVKKKANSTKEEAEEEPIRKTNKNQESGSQSSSKTGKGEIESEADDEKAEDNEPLPGQITTAELMPSSEAEDDSAEDDENSGLLPDADELTYNGLQETSGFIDPEENAESDSEEANILFEDYDDGYIYRKDSTINSDIDEDESSDLTFEEGEERDGLGAILNSISDSLAKSRTNSQMIDSIEEDLHDLDESIDYGAIHKGVKCTIRRPAVTDINRNSYEIIKNEIINQAKKLAKRCKFVEEDAAPIPITSYYGKKFMASQISKQNLKYFQKEFVNDPVESVKVAVLIDESGSMCGNRINAAKRAALLLYHFCEMKNIPCAVYGHSTESGVILRVYADFGYDANDRYRLMGIDAGGSNRDGYALRFLKEHIAEEEGNKKLLIIISDGQPADSGYYGVDAFMDLKQIVRECEKEGIGIIAAAIGSDKEIIEEIYGSNHFLSVDPEELDTLPKRLSKLVQNLLR